MLGPVPGALPPTPYFNLRTVLKDIIIVFIFQMWTLGLIETKATRLVSGQSKESSPFCLALQKPMFLFLDCTNVR